MFINYNYFFRCLVPQCDDPHLPHYEEPWLEMAIPAKTIGAITGEYEASQCEKYVFNTTATQGFRENYCTIDAFTKEIARCNEWVFDDDRTIVSDVSSYFNIVILFKYSLKSV